MLKPERDHEIPELTQYVAKAALPKGREKRLELATTIGQDGLCLLNASLWGRFNSPTPILR